MIVRTLTRAGVDEADWERPLGVGLPAPGYPRVQWWLVASVVALIAGLALLGVALVPVLFPPQALALGIESHPSLRQAALAWRVRYAADPAAARGLQIWSAEGSGYNIVQPLAPTEGGRASDAQHPLFRLERERWSVSLQQLAESLQSERLGEERLSRGAILVALSGESPGLAPRFLASAQSPLGGHDQASAPLLVPYVHCLPRLEPPLADAQLGTPMNPAATTKTVYWLVREVERVTVIATDACRSDALSTRQSRAAPIARDSVPLLSFDPRVDIGPFVLVLAEAGGADGALQVFKFFGTDPQRLERQAVERGLKGSGEGSKLYDSFEQGLGGAPGEPRTVARRVSEGNVEHLVWSGAGWRFASCPEPHDDVYRVEYSNCSGQIGTSVRLGPDQERKPAPEGGWNVWGWSKEGNGVCDIRVVSTPCGKT